MSDLSFSTVNKELPSTHQEVAENNQEVLSNDTTNVAQLDYLTDKVSLPKPTDLERIKLASYAKAKRLGVNPVLPNPPYGADYLNINFINRIEHRKASKAFEYNQKNFDMIYSANPVSALSNSVSAFARKESELERGIVINFFAA